MPTASRLTLATAILAGSIISASAADMPVAPPPPPPIYDWSGLYLGFGIGVANHEAEWEFVLRDPARRSLNHDFDQTRIQLHAGYQYMFGMGWGGIVLGVDLAAAFPLEDRFGSSAIGCLPVQAFCETRFNALYTVGGKLGLAFNQFMIYGAGGYAVADVNTHFLVVDGPVGGRQFGDGGWQDGWYFGAGVDWAAYKGNGIDLILGFEYKHIELDAARHFLDFGDVDRRTRDVTVTSDQFMAKATLKFGGLRWF
jgi:outer membrane immunogenic protein